MSDKKNSQESDSVIAPAPVRKNNKKGLKCGLGLDFCQMEGVREIPSPICATCSQNPGYIGGNCPN